MQPLKVVKAKAPLKKNEGRLCCFRFKPDG